MMIVTAYKINLLELIMNKSISEGKLITLRFTVAILFQFSHQTSI